MNKLPGITWLLKNVSYSVPEYSVFMNWYFYSDVQRYFSTPYLCPCSYQLDLFLGIIGKIGFIPWNAETRHVLALMNHFKPWWEISDKIVPIISLLINILLEN